MASQIPLAACNIDIRRSDFPRNFLFGVGTSAYQVEGAWNEGGKGQSIWDCFAMRNSGKIKGGANGCRTIESYSKMKEDIQLLKKMGVKAYRFSISWSRILPGGKLSMGKSVEGIEYYNQLIDELLANGIEPFVTIFHWDLPNALEEEYMGFLSPKIVEDFVNYADVCFWEFGDRVKNWVTLNEPYRFTYSGYIQANGPPGRGAKGEEGDPATEPYLVAYHLLRCHAETYRKYEADYKNCQGGKVGITLDTNYFKPYSGEIYEHSRPCTDGGYELDVKAVQYAYDFMFGWFLEPLTTGKWPQSMQEFAAKPTTEHPKGRTLPNLRENGLENKLIDSYDFLGINYYTANYAHHHDPSDIVPEGYLRDCHYHATGKIGKTTIGEPAFEGSWVYLCANELTDLLLYTKKKYNVSKPIIITENGAPENNDPPKSYEEVHNDTFRLKYIKAHLQAIREARRKHINVMGYFVWSYMDSFEWASGYTVRFGMIYVDYAKELQRYPKQSAIWFKNFLHERTGLFKRSINGIDVDEEPDEAEEATEVTQKAIEVDGEPNKAEKAIEVTQKAKKAKA